MIAATFDGSTIWWNSRSSCASQSHVQARRIVRPAGRPIAVREGRVVHAARQRFEGRAVGVLGRREGHRLRRPAMEPAAEREDDRATRRDPRELDRGLDRLGARVGQERLPRPAGQHVPKSLVQPQARLVVEDVLLAVEELAGLGGDRGRDARMSVSGVGHADPRRVVEVARAVAGDQPRTLAAVDVEVRDPAPDGGDDGVVGERRRHRDRIRGGVHHGVLPPREAAIRRRCWPRSRGQPHGVATTS